VRVVERPPGEVRERGEDDPERDALHPLPDEPDGTEEREQGGGRRSRELPDPERAVHECLRGRGDDEHLEDRPAEVLEDVEPGGEIRPGAAERRAQQHHGRHSCFRADGRRAPEHGVADDSAHEDREQRMGQRERRDEERAGDEHEEAEAEAAPQHPVLEASERPQARRNRRDAPGWCSLVYRSSLRRYDPDQVRRV
jgi:hypothetical protein